MTRTERIVTLDVLRGLALFGMILVHFHQKMEIPTTGVEDLIGWIVWMGMETKAWATFAFLFGSGFAILMRRAEARGLAVVPLFLRRMLALAVIGAAVEALTGFSILIEYAIWGVPLLFMRKLPTAALLGIALACTVALGAYYSVHPYNRGPYWSRLQNAEQHGTFGEAVAAGVDNMRWTYTQVRTFIPGSSFVLFIMGLLAMRHGIFDDPKRNRRLITSAMTAGFVSWAVFWFALPILRIDSGFGIISDQWLAFTYVGAVILLLAYRPVWKDRLAVFGITGRMALTNYVFQAAVFAWLGSGYGMALKVRPYLELPATIVLFSTMALFSYVWLRRFTYGPLERLWRSFTYLSWR